MSTAALRGSGNLGQAHGRRGRLRPDGYLRIVDRIKELIINTAGKNLSPASIESTVKTAGALIGNVCCIGDAHGVSGPAAADPRVREAVAAAVERANAQLSRRDRSDVLGTPRSGCPVRPRTD